MSLELAPEIESTIRRYAEREGVTINELLTRAFPPVRPDLPTIPNANADQAVRVSALLRQWQQEYGLPARPDGKVHTPVTELFAQWNAEDARLTVEEAEAEHRLWEDTQQHSPGVTM